MTLDAMILATSDRRARNGAAAQLRAAGLGMSAMMSMMTITTTTWEWGAAGVR